MLTLYHWDLPQALEDLGGWTNRDTSERFAEYSSIVYEDLSDSVGFWITLNEPWVSAWMGYGLGVHAPGHKDSARALAATHHLLLGHGLAVERMRSSRRRQPARRHLEPASRPAPREIAKPIGRPPAGSTDRRTGSTWIPCFTAIIRRTCSAYYTERAVDLSFVHDGDLDRISVPIDFLGINYYFRNTVRDALEEQGQSRPFADLGARPVVPHEAEKTAMGWPVEPDGLTEILVRIKDDYTDLPIYVTENGRAVNDYIDPEGDVDDDERVSYLDDHFRAAHEAIEQGVDLRGYMVWSFLDNFEWAEGYSKRFGISIRGVRNSATRPQVERPLVL